MRTTPEPDRPNRRPEYADSAEQHTFRCELCDRKRREEDRREPKSKICIHCMREAGFEE